MADFLYIASFSSGGNELLRGWSGTAMTTPAANAPRYIAGPWLNRYVIGHFTSSTATPSGANGGTSTVWFSNALEGALNFLDADWLSLDPDDGDELTGIVAWRELLFVIKRARMYVFYGVSTDATGGAIFNYRTITLPSRARVTSSQGGCNMVAGANGVYVLCDDGVYLTTGDTPQLVSRAITPLFDGTGNSAWLFPSSGNWSFGYATNRLYLSYQNGSSYYTLVYDILIDEWYLWDTSAGQSALPTNMAGWINSSGTPTAYYAAGAKILSPTRTATSDDGTAIVSRFQSGWTDLGAGWDQKAIRGAKVWGQGSVTLSILTDYGSTDASAAALTLGTAPSTAMALHTPPYRGALFSYKLSAASGLWQVNSLEINGFR